jgi:hypothetical protein
VPIVTAADHRFARTLHQMLASAERCALPAAHHISVVDLGMHERDRERIARRFPWCRIDPFEFTARPPHLRELGNFAWKPFLIFDLVSQGEGPILWFDSATLFHGGIEAMIDGVSRDGIFSLAGQSSLGECCDPRTLAKLQPAPEDLHEPYRAGGVLGFDPARPLVRDIVGRWRDLAADPACISPPGADRRRHKFDQALLTALLCRARREHGLRIGTDEIDISSTSPVRWVSTRNKVAPWVPQACDALVRAYYAIWKRADRTALRLKARRPATSYPRAYSR